MRGLPRSGALIVLALVLLAMAWAGAHFMPGEAQIGAVATAVDEGEGDIALYRRIAERMQGGEGYYAAALHEQQAGNYPAFPFVTVRLPTLAMLQAATGVEGARWLALVLLAGTVLAFLWRLRTFVSPPERAAAGALILFGGAAAITPEAGLIHELFAGLLLSLALMLYRPDRLWPSLLAAALALSIRELAAPFVLLWLAFALMERRWSEAGIVTALLGLFAVGMGLHYLGVESARLPGDPVSQGWDAFAGYQLPLFALSKLTALLLLPTWIAAPLAILPLLGWVGLGGRLGLFAALWFTGFLTAMALFARPENFYWAQLTLPAYFAGFAFVPRATADLVAAIKGAT